MNTRGSKSIVTRKAGEHYLLRGELVRATITLDGFCLGSTRRYECSDRFRVEPGRQVILRHPVLEEGVAEVRQVAEVLRVE